MIEITDPEDIKLVTLARGARSRVQAAEGAAVRDTTGRTYASANVSLPSLTMSAASLAVAQAVASGAQGIEAVIVIAERIDERDLSAIREAGGIGASAWLCAADGSPIDSLAL